MRILLVNWQDPSNLDAGGAEIHLLEVFSRLRAMGHSVTWVASGWSGCDPTDEIEGIAIRRIASRYTFGVAAAPFLRRHALPTDFDITVEALNKVPVYAPLWVRTPTALIVHHLFGTTAFQQASAPLAAATWLQERPIPSVYKRTAIQTISESTADDLASRGIPRRNMRVIYPGVDTDFFRPAPDIDRASTPTFLYIGRLQKYKRIDLIVEAFSSVLATVPSARLVIAGRGEQRMELEKRVEELGIAGSVRFAGFVSEEEKRALFQGASANIFVSPKEGWGITNLEAAACGTPTIASDAPGLRESVRHGETGFLVPHGDLEALCAAMLRLSQAPGVLEALGRAALGFARSFTWERTAGETLRHLEGVLAGPSRDPTRWS